MGENAEQVLGRGVTIGPEHAHEAAGRDSGRLFEAGKADRGVDVVAQDGATDSFIPGEAAFSAAATYSLTAISSQY
jgi:hypothetical protein